MSLIDIGIKATTKKVKKSKKLIKNIDFQHFKYPPGLLGIRYFQDQGPDSHIRNGTFQQFLRSDSIFQNVSQTYCIVEQCGEFFNS